MRKAKQVLRLKWEAGLSNRAISRALKVGRETVREYLHRAKEAGLTWEQVQQMDEGAIEEKLFPASDTKGRGSGKRVPDWSMVREELGRHKGVTLRLLWEEYYSIEPETAYSYSQFCHLYRIWSKKLPSVMVQVYKGGEYLFVDYAGQTVPYIDRVSGEEKRAQIFVASLGASSFTYVEAGQDLVSWISGHVNAFGYFGGVPEIVVPDNLKSGVKSPCYYEPDINPTYDELSLHYGFAVIPARVRRPRDKAKVETAVQVVERWILAPLRDRTFFSIEEINEAIGPLLERLNSKVMKHLEKSRRELFESIDRPRLKALPAHSFEYAERKSARVGINYHVTFNKHYYSVPYSLVKETVEIRATDRTIEVFYKGGRVASHLRDDTPGGYSTCTSHMPSKHRRRKQEWSPERFIRWAQKIGPWTCHVVKTLLGSKRHPEQAYRSCLGVLKLSDRYGEARLEAACKRAAQFALYAYRHIHNILKNNMDVTDPNIKEPRATTSHEHVRGQQYYH